MKNVGVAPVPVALSIALRSLLDPSQLSPQALASLADEGFVFLFYGKLILAGANEVPFLETRDLFFANVTNRLIGCVERHEQLLSAASKRFGQTDRTLLSTTALRWPALNRFCLRPRYCSKSCDSSSHEQVGSKWILHTARNGEFLFVQSLPAYFR